MKRLQEKVMLWFAWRLPTGFVRAVVVRAFAEASAEHPDKPMGELRAWDLMKLG